jgi:RNA polymerase sigma-70 factor, ECF subfamily
MTKWPPSCVHRQMAEEQEACWGRVAGVEGVPRPVEEPLALAAQRLAQGDLAALDLVWDLCARDLYGLALWRSGSVADAEDAVQEVFLRLATSPQALGRARGPRAYLLTMAHHAVVDVGRKGRGGALDADLLVVLPGPNVDPVRVADGVRASRLVRSLPAKQREVVFLKHFADLTFKEIGRITGVPTFTASSRYGSAMRRLRAEMGVPR